MKILYRRIQKGEGMRFLAVGLLILLSEGKALADVPSQKLINALIHVETGGNDNAVGDKHLPKGEWAYGCLQIRRPVLDDVNRHYGRNIKSQDLLGNRKLSVWVCKAYLSMYATEKQIGRKPTEQDMARIWNGGPDGWKKKSTQKYWFKVKSRLEQG